MNQQSIDRIQKLRQLARHGYLDLSDFFTSLTQEECVLYATYKELCKKLDEGEAPQVFHSLSSMLKQIVNSEKLDENEKNICLEVLRLKECWYEAQYQKYLQERSVS